MTARAAWSIAIFGFDIENYGIANKTG